MEDWNAPSGVTDHRDLGLLLQDHCGDKYPYALGKFVLDAPAGTEVVSCTALTDAGRFNTLIDHFSVKFGTVDRRAIVSLWTMYYFSTLTIGAALAWLELRRVLPLALDDVSLIMEAETALPVGFLLPDLGYQADLPVHQTMAPALRHHAEPLIAAIALFGGLSPKVIWHNAASYLGWIIEEVGLQTDPALTAEGRPLMEDGAFPDGARNPMFGALKPMTDDDGQEFKRRKVCCLRYCIPSIGGCGMSCPLPEGRQA